MLFLVDPLGKTVRLETGYDLEGIFTDAFTGSNLSFIIRCWTFDIPCQSLRH